MRKIYPKFRTRDPQIVVSTHIIPSIPKEDRFMSLITFLEGYVGIIQKQNHSETTERYLSPYDQMTERMEQNTVHFQILEYGIHIHTTHEKWKYGIGHPMETIWDAFYWGETGKPRTDLIEDPVTVLSINPYMNLYNKLIPIIKHLEHCKVSTTELRRIQSELIDLTPITKTFHFKRYDHRVPANVIYQCVLDTDMPDTYKEKCKQELTKLK